MKLGGLARWPLLMGAVILFCLALWEESHETANHTTVAVVSLSVGCVLLGGWVHSLIVSSEREYHDDKKAHPPCEEDGPQST